MSKKKDRIPPDLILAYGLTQPDPTPIPHNGIIFQDPVPADGNLGYHFEDSIQHPTQIIKKEVMRTVSYKRAWNGVESPLDNKSRRDHLLARYTPNKTKSMPDRFYCVCQMCAKAYQHDFIEINHIEEEPSYYWEDAGLALCLNCSKQFEEMRRDSRVSKKFVKSILEQDTTQKQIDIAMGIHRIHFSPKHIKILQEIYKKFPPK